MGNLKLWARQHALAVARPPELPAFGAGRNSPQLRHALPKGASLNTIVEFGLVFLPVLAYSLLATFPNCIQRYITY